MKKILVTILYFLITTALAISYDPPLDKLPPIVEPPEAVAGMVLEPISGTLPPPSNSQLFEDAIAIWDFEGDSGDTKGPYNLTALGTVGYGSTDPPQGSQYATFPGGSGNYFTYPDDPAFDPGGDYTVSFWVWQNTPVNVAGLICKIDYSATGNGWEYSYDWGTPNLQAFHINAWNENLLFSTFAQTADTWYHMCLVFSEAGGNITQYISAAGAAFGSELNGIPLSMPVTPGSVAQPLNIGGPCLGHITTTLIGSMDEVVYWNQALTATDCQNIFEKDWR